jgi:pseudouridine synthase
VDGRRLKPSAEKRYLLLNKPRGVVSTRSDPQRRRTVIDLLAALGVRGYLYPVGRLDYDSEGLIILTNDGEFAERVSHPRYQLPRTYEVEVEGVPDDRDLERLRRGIVLDGWKTQPAQLRVMHTRHTRGRPRTVIELTLREGRNRQVRRMCDAIAHPVDRLRRIRIGPVSDRRLKPGQVRELTPAEIRALTGGRARSRSPKAPQESS